MKHNWEYKPVSEIFDTVTDFVAAGSFADLRENVIYNNERDYAQLIRTTDLKNNFSNSQFVYVNEHAFNYLWRVNLAEECIILPNIGNCGEVYYLHPSMLIYQNNVLGPNAIMVRSKKHNHKYLAFALKGNYFQRQLFQIVSQVAQSKFNKTNLKKLLVPVPSLEVQEQIVAELDKINEVIADCRELLRNLDALAQSLYNNYFGDYYNDNYYFKPIKEVFDTITDFVAAGSFASLRENVIYKECPNYAQLVRTMDIKSNFTKGQFVYVDKHAFDFLWRVNLNSECIILPNIGVNCGEVYYIHPSMLKYQNNVLGPNAILIRSSRFNHQFLSFALKNNDFQQQLSKVTSQVAQPKFNKTNLKELYILLPPLALQEKFAARIEQIEEQKKAVEQTIAELQTLLDSRMDYWFN
ncbi:MAG: restriction endonuclease subunit S [Bacteroidales bacterium]|nr:restriction endonuclease subunit S [Bacteroidales bacterium]